MAHPPRRATQGHLLTDPGEAGLADDLTPALRDLADRLQRLAIARGITVGTAESCTGGLVGHVITSIPGSSGYYLGGVISYADGVKRDLLGVSSDVLARHGAVSAQVAVAMAEGLRVRLGCDVAVAVTGVAGPDGGTEAKPVGLTYVGTAGAHGSTVRRQSWSGDRAANKHQSAALALEMLIAGVEAAPGVGADR